MPRSLTEGKIDYGHFGGTAQGGETSVRRLLLGPRLRTVYSDL